MSNKVNELRQKRAALIAEARAHLNSTEARAANGVASADDLAKYDLIVKDAETVGKQIEAEERQLELDRQLAQASDEQRQLSKTATTKEDREAAALRSYFLTGVRGPELRNLQSDLATAGGFTVLPEVITGELLKFIDNDLFIRKVATIFKLKKAVSLGVITLDTDIDDADWTTELATGSEDSGMVFGKRALVPHPLAKRIKVSNNLLANSSLDIMKLVMERMAYKFGVTLEKAYLTGNGAGQPLGMFTPSANGISTARDFSTGNTATSLSFDGLIGAKYNVKSQYQGKNGAWLFNRAAISQLAKLKDGNGQYIWQPAVTDCVMDQLLCSPVYMSEYVPSTFTTGQYLGIYGDMSKYYIVDSMEFGVQVLKELYAETNQTGFIGRYEGDGMPVLEEAFTRIKLA